MILNFILEKLQHIFAIDGEFKIIEGASTEFPELPKDLDNAMKLATY